MNIRSTIRTSLILIVIATASGLLHYFGILTPIERLGGSFMGSLTGGIYGRSQQLQDIFHAIISPNQGDTVDIINELNNLRQENGTLRIVQDENAALRKQLHFMEGRTEKWISADVVRFGREQEASILVINRGSDDGIRAHSAVVAHGGVYIGKVLTVSPRVSSILLLNDSRSKTIATIANKKPTTGIVQGEFQIGLVMNLIPIEEDIRRGEIVVTAGLEENIPKNLLIGTVSELRTKPTDSFHITTIQPAIRYTDIRSVTVLIP